MNLEDKNLSVQFYNYLCNIVGSEEVVRTRRGIFAVKDILENTTGSTSISSGSKAEGLDLKGSDYDQMIILNFIRVYESLNNDQYDPNNLLCVMDTNNTKPGFTKIRLVNKSDIDKVYKYAMCDTVGESTFISSKRFRNNLLSGNMIIHGPCLSTPGGEYDIASPLRCKEWITPAQQWIHRSRTLWPHYTLVTSAVQYGVLFVPIGCKNSPNEDLQWRISFSVTERQLIHSFSHTQLLCYALLKIILKDIIKPRHGDLLCSYFLKTIMFWLSEEINPSEWTPDNMIFCVLDCIRRLIYCVEYKTCLHYFIPENDLFEDRFTGNDHKALLDTLRCVYGSPWTSVFHTETFLNYRLQSENLRGAVLSASTLSCFYYISQMYDKSSMNSAFKRFGNGFNNTLRKDICAHILFDFSRETIQSSDIYNMTNKNKSFYKQYKKVFSHFKISLQSNSVSSWLLLASLFYKCKRFHECLYMINYCLFICTHKQIRLHTDNNLVEQTIFKEMKQRLGVLLTFKYLIIEFVCFKYPFCLLPYELISLITDKSLMFHPVMYSYLLQFLCCHHLGDYKGKHNALHDLERPTRARPNEYIPILHQVYKSLAIVQALL